jgi:hypothetical protein
MKSWIIAGALLAFGVLAWAETPIRQQAVQFKKGASSATLKGSVHGHETVDYKLRAGAGQKMEVKLASASTSVAFNVLPPGSEEAIFIGPSSGNEFSGTLPAAGEYRIRVFLDRASARRGAKASFSLFVAVTGPSAKPAAAPSSPDTLAEKESDATVRAGMGRFDATGKVPCAQARGQPMAQCGFGAARAGGGSGSATVVITRPDGRKRAIFFTRGKPIGADTSQADGYGEFRARKESDLHRIEVGDERYEIPDAVVFGG